jgi:hypothetical protein
MENVPRHWLGSSATGRRTSRYNGPGLAVLAPAAEREVSQTRTVGEHAVTEEG